MFRRASLLGSLFMTNGTGAKVSVKLTLHSASGVEKISLEESTPEIVVGDGSLLKPLRESDSRRAVACIYCESTDQLSKEHVIPLALGGMVLIWDGSCEECRNETQRFEGEVLQGEMRKVRLTQGLPSRSGYKNSHRNGTKVLRGGDQVDIDPEEVPTLFTYPIFGLPKHGRSGDPSIKMQGTATYSYGIDPEEFLKKMGASEITLEPPKAEPVAFARLVAKVAFGFAWLQDYLSHLEDSKALVNAFMRNTRQLGLYVGTKPDPYIKYEGVSHRVEFKVSVQGVLYAEIQLFAESGSPTYLVAFGLLKPESSLRQAF